MIRRGNLKFWALAILMNIAAAMPALAQGSPPALGAEHPIEEAAPAPEAITPPSGPGANASPEAAQAALDQARDALVEPPSAAATQPPVEPTPASAPEQVATPATAPATPDVTATAPVTPVAAPTATATAPAATTPVAPGATTQQLAAPQPVELLKGEEVPGAPVFTDEQYGSLVFTYWEHVAISDAKKARGLVRPPTEEELARDLKERDDGTPKPKPPPEEREIRLAGIAYHGTKDWTIWLNEKRVTPDAIPKEVMDLKVTKGYIEMKWFDEWSNQIYPIRLRPHQRFNLDVRMFLPG